jgi:hypothetical protein
MSLDVRAMSLFIDRGHVFSSNTSSRSKRFERFELFERIELSFCRHQPNRRSTAIRSSSAG